MADETEQAIETESAEADTYNITDFSGLSPETQAVVKCSMSPSGLLKDTTFRLGELLTGNHNEAPQELISPLLNILATSPHPCVSPQHHALIFKR